MFASVKDLARSTPEYFQQTYRKLTDIFRTKTRTGLHMLLEGKHSCGRLPIKSILSVISHNKYIAARCLINIVYITGICLYQVTMMLHFLNDVINDAESTQKANITS